MGLPDQLSVQNNSTQAQEAVEALILLSTEMLHWANEDKEWIEGKK
jgi:hypothetical protein